MSEKPTAFSITFAVMFVVRAAMNRTITPTTATAAEAIRTRRRVLTR